MTGSRPGVLFPPRLRFISYRASPRRRPPLGDVPSYLGSTVIVDVVLLLRHLVGESSHGVVLLVQKMEW